MCYGIQYILFIIYVYYILVSLYVEISLHLKSDGVNFEIINVSWNEIETLSMFIYFHLSNKLHVIIVYRL